MHYKVRFLSDLDLSMMTLVDHCLIVTFLEMICNKYMYYQYLFKTVEIRLFRYEMNMRSKWPWPFKMSMNTANGIFLKCQMHIRYNIDLCLKRDRDYSSTFHRYLKSILVIASVLFYCFVFLAMMLSYEVLILRQIHKNFIFVKAVRSDSLIFLKWMNVYVSKTNCKSYTLSINYTNNLNRIKN
jgi:hypothetical protein